MASFGQLTGDLEALTRFGDRVAEIGSQRTLTRLNKELAEEAIIQARDGFREERDPYGKKWPRKVFPDGRKVLRGSTEKLYNGFRVLRADARGFEMGNVEPHAKFTFGTGLYGPNKRRIYPKTAKALVIGGSQGRASSGQFTRNLAFHSVKGSPERLIVPVAGRVSKIWQTAFKRRATKFLAQYFTKKR